MICSTCGTENEAGRKFCLECGAPLAVACGVCGTPNNPRAKFCGECGTALAGGVAAPVPARPAPPVSERRLVTVLFADLVGFTSLSEARDPDEVRDLLSRYFELSRQVIARYGGTVEKFIGDAVMAVWGTPVAREDDPERAVRAALDLVGAVEDLGAEVGAEGLRARAGVMTGEAAVTLGATGEGMVAGDLVNTASRVQALAEPGTVLAGDATRRATEAAIVYEGAGTHPLKGKAEPIPLYRAVRVVGGVGGALKSTGLEAPFVGRDRELRLVKELFHTTFEERRAHLLQVLGIAGIGKSRLAWEFYKYLDGITEVFLWHRGRCPAYGEGVTYWALAEMVRGRCGILEGEDPASAEGKLRTTLAEYVPDPEERAFVEPRLAHLLGLEERTAREPEDLFSAWRLFVERLADRNPVTMVFEDMQWADRSLLDFIDYLLNWSRSHPIFVLALARPEISERHPDWAAPRRGATALHLEPLAEEDMHHLLTGLIPGIPEGLERQILDRAEGVPLYAMETVRMLLDRGLLEQEGGHYRLTGAVETLEVPETLHALIAARLDGLDATERSLLQVGAVLGKTFTRGSLSALTGITEQDVEALLKALVRKEVLFVQADPRSPERGQYGFLQDLVRRVAYETLSRKERKARHLAAARHMEETWGGEEVEIVEVVASHYLEAYHLEPEAPDSAEIKRQALEALIGAGKRSESLAASQQAFGYFAKAIELADDPLVLADLHERAGDMLLRMAQEGARGHLEEAIAIYGREGEPRGAARAAAKLGEVAFGTGRLEEAAARMEEAFEVLSKDEPDETLATVAVQQARMLLFAGKTEAAFERNELALQLAEALDLPRVFSHGLNTKGVYLGNRGRPDEGLLLVQAALKVALDNDVHDAAIRGYNNLASFYFFADRPEESFRTIEEGMRFANRLGYSGWALSLSVSAASALIFLGRWDEAVARLAEIQDEAEVFGSHEFVAGEAAPFIELYARRGELEQAERLLQQIAVMEHSDRADARSEFHQFRSVVLRAQGRLEEAQQAAERALGEEIGHRGIHAGLKYALMEAIEGALSVGNLDRAEELLAEIERARPGERTPLLVAGGARLRAKLDAAKGNHDGVEQSYQTAALEFRGIPNPFWVAVTLLEHGEWLVGRGRAEDAAPVLAEARGIFEELRARPWLERLDAVGEQVLPGAGAARA